MGPAVEVENMLLSLPVMQTLDGFYAVSCGRISSLPTLNIHMGGANFPLKPKDYVLSNGEDECVLGIVGADTDLWILGDVFLRRYVSVYDFGEGRVGFADGQRDHSINVLLVVGLVIAGIFVLSCVYLLCRKRKKKPYSTQVPDGHYQVLSS